MTTLADDLAATISDYDVAMQTGNFGTFTESVYELFRAHGAELAALVAENAPLRAALEEAWAFIASDWGGTSAADVERIRQPLLATITTALDAALRGPS